MTLCTAISIRLNNILNERKLNPHFLTRMGGVSYGNVRVILRNPRKRMTINLLFEICATLEMSLEEFFSDSLFNKVDD